MAHPALSSIWTYTKVIFGSSRTIAFGYFLELAAAGDELKVVDWSSIFGAEKGGRIAALVGLGVIFLRVITRGPVRFRKMLNNNEDCSSDEGGK